MDHVQPFTVSFPEARVKELKERLAKSTYPDELDNANWDLGAPVSDIRRIANHWQTRFDWNEAEARLNELPQYTTPIECEGGFEELSIHFVHVKSQAANAIPLLFCHGWPGSAIEVSKIAGDLVKGQDGGPAFHVVAPSLPNFGFSQGTRKRGFAIEQYAETCHKLMLRLGYDKYATQGGDWGWYVTRTMSLLYPKSCLATHFNMDVGDPPASLVESQPGVSHPLPPTPTMRETKGAQRTAWFDQEGFGYNMLQSTKPQTIAYALADSPVALLGWIYEKLHDWADDYPWTDDEICTWVSIYWFSNAGPAAACRIYYEMIHDKHGRYVPYESLGKGFEGAVSGTTKVTRKWLKQDHGTGVKIGQSHFPNDIHVLPSAWTSTIGTVVFEREHASGGHFAAYEKPKELVEDLRVMFEQDNEARQPWLR
ncbi:hypothetical protein OHC33_009567 [Knufia fluminis]|uniref:Epoxide hydrolase N-terminal domain-containing protein n=1 Tax=Knufia fluminis TaxID=191047 RepID=A0AAN8E912_9EURO|nr:hypothetical protein OHC33_009567 [Knufia fluminis]